MKLAALLCISTVICAASGCNSKSTWSSAVVQTAENPRSGSNNFFPVRAEVVEHRCGLLRRDCTTVRLVDETGFNDVFTYIGDPRETSINWIDFHHLQISCKACASHTIELQRKDTNYMNNIYVAYEI